LPGPGLAATFKDSLAQIENLPSDRAERADSADQSHPKHLPHPPYPKANLRLLEANLPFKQPTWFVCYPKLFKKLFCADEPIAIPLSPIWMSDSKTADVRTDIS
jgi:hypothetical protein